MDNQPLIIEGSWQEVAEIGANYADRRVRLIILPAAIPSDDTVPAPSIEEEIASIWADVTEEEWKTLPPDLSEQVDHYVYGTPKR
jgi:hypothetical protein